MPELTFTKIDEPTTFDPALEGSAKPRGLGENIAQNIIPSGASLREYAAGSMEGLKQAATNIPTDAASLLGDLFHSFLPTRGGAEAAGRFFGKLGDIATFATGGLMNPLEPAGMARGPAGLTRGLDIQPIDRVTPPLALPKPPLALPPPQSTVVPGQPWSSTGQGMIPGSPRAIMHPPLEQPPVGPDQAPQMVRMPRAQVSSPGGAKSEPLVRLDAAEDRPSQLATALVQNDGNTVDRALVSRYRRAVRPGFPDRRSFKGMDAQDHNITTAADAIIENRDSLLLTNAKDLPLSPGTMPSTLREFSQSIDQLKSRIYDQYDNLAMQRGGAGVRVPLQPAAARLRQLAMEPQISDRPGSLQRDLIQQAELWEQAGSYTPKQAQNVVQTMNRELETTIRNPSDMTSTKNTAMADALGVLRETLNNTVDAGLTEPQYRNLRIQHGALTSIEKHVANAMKADAARTPGGLAAYITSAAFWINAAHGVVTMDPRAIPRAVTIAGAAEVFKRLHNPNRAVKLLFRERSRILGKERQPGIGAGLSAAAAVRLGEIRQQLHDANARGDLNEMQRLSRYRSRLYGGQ